MNDQDIINLINNFDKRCEEEEETDTGEAWELLNTIRDYLMKR